MKTISAFLLVLSAAPLFGQQKQITLQDLIQTNPARPGVLSPDGKKFAVTEKGQIALKPVTGWPPVRVTTDPAPKSEVSWSPDSRKLAYVSKGDIWIVSISRGGTPRPHLNCAVPQHHRENMFGPHLQIRLSD